MTKDFIRKLLFAAIMALATSGSVAVVGTLVRNGLSSNFFTLWWRSFKIAYPVVVFSILFFAAPVQRLVNRMVR